MTVPETADERSVKLSCRNLWKLYGVEAERVMGSFNGNPTADDLRARGVIGALRDVSLDIYDGEIFVIMGLSGSGKSTLIRNLSLLVEPTAGSILFDDRDLLSVSQKELIQIRRHKMGMVFQNFALLPHLTVLQNVAFPLDIQGATRKDRELRALEMIELVGLNGRESYYPRELSGGQQQRVGIARSLAVEPELWFLDEPFSALDPLIRRDMQNEFLRLQAMLGKTIVFITHDFDEAVKLADRMAILKDGVVEQIGTPEELILNPATEYVAEFTHDVSKQRVIKVSSLTVKGKFDGSMDNPLNVAKTIGAVARQVINSTEEKLPVADESGAIIGYLPRKLALDILEQEADDG